MKPLTTDQVQAIVPAFLRPKDAALYMGISRRQLSNWTRKGLLAKSRIGPRCTLYAVADLHAAVARFRVGGFVHGRN